MRVGEIVLFKIDPSDFGVWRPLLVKHVHDDGSVDGEVFFCWERDRRAQWPGTKLFHNLSPDVRTVEVRNIHPGELVGNYQAQQPAAERAVYAALEGRIAALEGLQMKKPAFAPPRPLVPEKRSK